jgi:hypothetical protein
VLDRLIQKSLSEVLVLVLALMQAQWLKWNRHHRSFAVKMFQLSE